MQRKESHSEYYLLLSKIIIAVGLTAVAAWISTRISQAYYNVSIFHYDSSSYLASARVVSANLQKNGLWAAFLASIQSKDSLDVTLRVLFAPAHLQTLFGHMTVLIPFMALFVFLLLQYTYKRTQSMLAAIAVAGMIFCFPIMYNPYMGIADYWKESIAIWIVGAAIISWMESDRLARSGWAIVCSSLLGLLVMQRTALAVYMAMLFLPLFLYAVYVRVRDDDLKTAVTRIGAFVVPVGALGSMVLFIQWKMLYAYYFVVGYAYDTPLRVAVGIKERMRGSMGPLFRALPYIGLIALLLSNRKVIHKDFIFAMWFMIGFPLVVIEAHTLYFGIYNVLMIMCLILLATMLPTNQYKSILTRAFFCALLATVMVFSYVQYHISSKATAKMVKIRAPWHATFDWIAAVLRSQPKPVNYTFIFDPYGNIFVNHMVLNRGIAVDDYKYIDIFMIHDSEYVVTHKTKEVNVSKAAADLVDKLEAQQNLIVISACSPRSLASDLEFRTDGQKFALPIAQTLTDYLYDSPHWQAIAKSDSPHGCLYAYKYSEQPISKSVKWHAVS